MYDVYATSEAGAWPVPLGFQIERYLWANASVSAESGSEGWSSVWAEAGKDTYDSYEGGAYIAGSNGHSRFKGAGSWVHRFNDPDQRRYTHAHPQKRVLKTYFASFLITLAETQSLTDMIAIAREEGFL